MIKVSLLQRGNKLLEYLSSTTWHYDSSCSADYEINFSTLVLFLSLKFHSAKPEYIYKRIAKLKDAKLKILMVLIDTPNYNTTLQVLFRKVPITIVTCKNYDECAKYMKGFDFSTKRGTEVLRRKESGIDNFLQAFPRINKSDSVNIQRSFHTILDFIKADEKEISNIVGIGKNKAQQVQNYLKKPFKKPM